jgi:hypothetical protein
MTIEVNNSAQFKIKELSIVTKAGPIDISGIYEEINLFDSMLVPVMSGNILIRDSIGLSGKLIFDGSESILIEIAKSEKSDIASFKKAFRIIKQSNRTEEGLNSEAYTLDFVSDELVYSNQQKINQSYDTTYTEVVKKIIVDYLRVPPNNLNGLYESTVGIKKIVVPNLRPLDAIQWCAKRSVDNKQSPNFMFFQNITGYNFVSLSTLLSQEEILDIKFEMKNQKGNNSINEMSGARSIEVVSQTDSLKRTQSGVDAGKFVGIDPMTRVVGSRNIGFADHYNNMSHGNDNPNVAVIENRGGVKNVEAFDSKKTVAFFSAARKYSNYIKKYEPESLSKEDNTEDYIFQRKAIIENLMSKRLKVVMPGNFQLSSGFNVNVIAPTLGKKEKGTDNEDVSMSGKYVIVATRHVIGYNKHETIIEVASTSTNNEFVPVSNPQQNSQLLEY